VEATFALLLALLILIRERHIVVRCLHVVIAKVSGCLATVGQPCLAPRRLRLLQQIDEQVAAAVNVGQYKLNNI
jgi:hypothetical protein